jgi:hypothetical protein
MIKIIFLLFALNSVPSESVGFNPEIFEIYKQPYFPIVAKLIHIERLHDTHEFKDGKRIKLGRPAQYITLWDCGPYGHLISDKEKVYRWAAFESTLILQNYKGIALIKDIKIPGSIFDEVDDAEETHEDKATI